MDLINLETRGIHDDPQINDNGQAISNLNKYVQYQNSRYQLKWLWNSDQPELPDNRKLRNQVLKNEANKEFLTAYDAVIKDQLTQGIIEEVPDENQR